MQTPPDNVYEYYGRGKEQTRLYSPLGTIEFERTVEIVRRSLPPALAVVADIGAGSGVYTWWLVSEGYTVRYRDLIPFWLHGRAKVEPQR
jgi:hypothetical protein